MRERISSSSIRLTPPLQFQWWIEQYVRPPIHHFHQKNLEWDLGIFQPFCISICWIKLEKANTKNGWSAKPTLKPKWLRTCSTALVILWFLCPLHCFRPYLRIGRHFAHVEPFERWPRSALGFLSLVGVMHVQCVHHLGWLGFHLGW